MSHPVLHYIMLSCPMSCVIVLQSVIAQSKQLFQMSMFPTGLEHEHRLVLKPTGSGIERARRIQCTLYTHTCLYGCFTTRA